MYDWSRIVSTEHHAARSKLAFGKLGLEFHPDPETGKDIIVPGGQQLAVRPDLGGAIPKIEDAPWPGFPADLTSLAIVAATQTEGTSIIHYIQQIDRVDERIDERLNALGAKIRCLEDSPRRARLRVDPA